MLWSAVVAAVLRLAWVAAVPTKPVGDFALYRESAAYLVEHGSLDSGFVFMPGYVLLLALLERLGGGLLAAKLLGVGFGALAAAAAAGTAGALFDRRAGFAAGLAAAIWPAGVAMASVTGTDMPAAALIAAAVWALVRLGPGRPRTAVLVCGALLGAASSIRAVALPLAGASGLYWLARRERLGTAAARAALTLAVALVLLAPWAIRNRARYGEWFLTDSHGGHTALCGANPNSDGRYSRSLNRLFHETTGFEILTEPHRESDREAYAWARRFAAFEPAFAVGLVGAKAERLLARERGLLYWPVFRAGVLPAGRAAWFAGHRAALEAAADVFWWATALLALAGVGLCVAWREDPALVLVAFALALAALYAVFFAEPRYQLPITLLGFPLAAAAVTRLRRGLADRRAARVAVAFAVLAPLAFAGFLRFCEGLRAGHRWAAALCRVDGIARACLWRRADAGPGDSPVRGTWDAVGLAAPGAAETTVDLPAGRYHASGRFDPPGAGAMIAAAADHRGGPYRVHFAVPAGAPVPVWLSDLRIEREVMHNLAP